ncbi:MAG TPA: CPBP family intramembrane glutamic endopeptidase [Candidatus Dormibacteraeota bacterium]|nr:CPBP family intramembrane glutamic endopeptidase [Candidatus Dormibacteraeota bacterium]
MSPFDDSPSTPPEPLPGNESPAPVDAHPTHSSEPLAGDPLAFATPSPVPPLPSSPQYPEDLQITWSWIHGVCLILFGFVSLVMVQGILAVYYLPHGKKLTTKQMEEYLLSKPQFAIGSMLIWYATIFFFLYVTLSLLRGHSFWQCLGWRKINSHGREQPRNPFVYFIAGSGLSLFVALLTARMKEPENIPMQELFKHRQTALLFVAMAVLVAPLVEETLFRGYLYPLFARLISALLRFFGIEDAQALRSGILGSIILTGVLFGLMHGAQLGWTWSLVSMLILVGIIFTLVRARTGSVFASFLMHLGYNSLIAVAAVLSTHGFTKIPAGQ